MRELTKSMLSLSWALSLFGLKQAAALFTPGNNTTGSFEAVTRCAEEQLGSATRSTFRAGDSLQRGLVDLTFAFFTFGFWQPRGGRGGWGQGDGGWSGGRRFWEQGDGGQGVWDREAGQQGEWQQGGWGQGAGDSASPGGWTVGGAAAAGADVARNAGDMTAQAVGSGIDLMQQGIDAAYQVAGGGSAPPSDSPGGQGPSPSGEYQTSWAQTR